MKYLKKRLLGPIQVSILAIAIAAIGSYVYAGSYAEPTCSPPSVSCNADAPINVSTTAQFKKGSLGVGKTTAPLTALDVTGTMTGDNLAIISNATIGGTIKISGGNPGAGKVLTSNAVGLASWATSTGGGSIGGSGTTNIVPKWTNSTTLGNSTITDNGTNIIMNMTEGLSIASNSSWISYQGTNNYLGGITYFRMGNSPFTIKATINGETGQMNAFSYFYNSDRSLKTNIAPLQNSLDKVLQLQGVSYNLNDNPKNGGLSKQTQVGVVAQDVEKVYPEIVSTSEDGYKEVDYARLVAPLIEAVKAQQKEIDQLKAQVKELQNKK